MEFIKTENLSFKYNDGSDFIFKNVNLSVSKGEFVAVMGKSSSGKSTFLKQFKPFMLSEGRQTGNIFLNGENLKSIESYTQNRRICYIPQTRVSQCIAKKAIDEIVFGIHGLEIEESSIKMRVAEISGFLSLDNVLQQNMSNLSCGQKQLVYLVSAAVLRPEMIILDDPISCLDPISLRLFINILEKINKKFSTTFLISAKSLKHIYKIVGKIFFLDSSQNVQTINKNDIFVSSKNNKYLFSCPHSKFNLYLENFSENLDTTFEDFELTNIEKHSSKKLKSPPGNTELRKVLPLTKDKILDIQNLNFKYGINSQEVLRNLNIEIYSGEIISIMGRNGCGKSTLLKTICKINLPYTGKIIYKGKTINKYKDSELFINNISFFPQHSSVLLTEDTVLENLNPPEKYIKNDINKEAKKIFDQLEITNLLDININRLSMGEKQIVALAKVFLTSPRLLILDDPTASLDLSQEKRFKRILKEASKAGTAVLIASNDIDFCAEISDRCALLFQGEIAKISDTKNFLKDNCFYTA